MTIVMTRKVELRVLANRDSLGSGVGGGNPAATPLRPLQMGAPTAS